MPRTRRFFVPIRGEAGFDAAASETFRLAETVGPSLRLVSALNYQINDERTRLEIAYFGRLTTDFGSLEASEAAVYDYDDAELARTDIQALADAVAQAPDARAPHAIGTPVAGQGAADHARCVLPLRPEQARWAGMVILLRFRYRGGPHALQIDEGHEFRVAFGASVEAVPALHLYIGSSYWCAILKDGGVYKVSHTDEHAGVSVAGPLGGRSELIDVKKAEELTAEDIASFRVLVPFSVIRQMRTTDEALGREFLDNEFAAMEANDAFEAEVVFNGVALALVIGMWEGVRQNLPFAEAGLLDPLRDVKKACDPSLPPVVRLLCLASFMGSTGVGLLKFLKAGKRVAGPTAKQEIRTALRESVEAIEAEAKKLEKALGDIPTPPANAKLNELHGLMRDLRYTNAQLDDFLDRADYPAMSDAVFRSYASMRMGSTIWNTRVKALKRGFRDMQDRGMGKLVDNRDNHFRTLDFEPGKRGQETIVERGMSATALTRDEMKRFVKMRAPNTPLDDAMVDQIQANFRDHGSTWRFRCDLIQISHDSKTIMIIDHTGSLDWEHAGKTTLYEYLFLKANPEFQGFRVVSMEVPWRV